LIAVRTVQRFCQISFSPASAIGQRILRNFYKRGSHRLYRKKHQMPYNNNLCWPAGIILLLLPLVRIGCPPKLVSYRNNRNLELKLVSAQSETRRLFWLFRFNIETRNFGVSKQPKQTKDQPKQQQIVKI
jgi:hypothetical protein